MAIIVQKYGGSSLKSTERINEIADRIIAEQKDGNQLVVVVSAMGDSTNRLLDLSYKVSSCLNGREKDLLLSTGEQVSSALTALALQEKGAEAIAMTGQQAGIEAEYVHGDARITTIHTSRIERALQSGKIVVVAGFQGCTTDGEICTLGRGGSDTTAVALAAALKAERCDIFTDVDGIYDADPRLIPHAKKHTAMDYDSMLAMAAMGAEVIHPRAVAHAKEYHFPLVVRSSFTDKGGTWIHDSRESSGRVAGLTYQQNLCHLHLTGRIKKEDVLSRIAGSGVIGTGPIPSETDGFILMMKEDDIDPTISHLENRKESLGIQTMQVITGRTAIHLVFANTEEKRKHEKLLKGKAVPLLEDTISINCHPSVWSVSLPEGKGVYTAQTIYDAVIGMSGKKVQHA
ncbi:aspartate kinase [Halobacillus dabanensis]|uniref:Aspartokinase n=1 Tax=Halobacillus dabanensis TaxID=240302 RepID=A0A1I3WRR4_HALDA|nr:aspartate kinase [Halobacillus dabanensis]SFK09893.1 aspartate kinase [Halobacillus dabanensis]